MHPNSRVAFSTTINQVQLRTREIINPFRFAPSYVILNTFSAIAILRSPSIVEILYILAETLKAVPNHPLFQSSESFLPMASMPELEFDELGGYPNPPPLLRSNNYGREP